MKTLLILPFLGCIYFFVPKCYTQQITYPIDLAPITIPDQPVNLKARIIDRDHFTITLVLQSDESRKIEETVRPFELTNFEAKVKAGLSKLLSPEQSGATNDPQKSSSSKSFDQIPYAQLFFQLKGGELVTREAAQALRPKAGDLCFKPKLLVLESSSSQSYQSELLKKREKEAEVENNIIKLQNLGGITQTFTEKEKKKLRKELYRKYDTTKKADQKRLKEELLKNFQQTRKEFETATDSLRYLRNWKKTKEVSLKSYGSPEMIKQSHLRRIEDMRLWLNEELTSLALIDLELAKYLWDLTDNENIPFVKTSLQELQKRMPLEGLPKDQNTESFKQKAEMLNSIVKLYLEFIDLKNRDIEAEIKSGDYDIIKMNLTKEIRNMDTTISRIEPRLKILKNTASDIQIQLKKTGGSYLPFEVDYVEIEFNEGFIEQIVVVGYIDISQRENAIALELADNTVPGISLTKPKLVFTNYWPLGFSRKQDFNQLRNIRLFASAEDYENDKYELVLGDLILNYIPKAQVNRRDFSPENRVVTYDPKKDESCIVLYKEDTYKLFEARVYSDLVGIDSEKPNGLVQTEVAKRINLNTRRYTTRNAVNLGKFSWFEPKIALSKIENNNKYLTLNRIYPDSQNRRLVSTLDVREREAFNIGASGNLIYVDLPYYKCNFAINAGFRYGRTPVQIDTLRTGLNTLTFFPELILDVRGDERWGGSLGLQFNRMQIFGRHIKQVASSDDPDNKIVSNITNGRWFGTSHVFVFFQPSIDSDGRLFIRYRYNWQLGDDDLGFHQAQFGYSFYLLGRNKKEAKPGN